MRSSVWLLCLRSTILGSQSFSLELVTSVQYILFSVTTRKFITNKIHSTINCPIFPTITPNIPLTSCFNCILAIPANNSLWPQEGLIISSPPNHRIPEKPQLRGLSFPPPFTAITTHWFIQNRTLAYQPPCIALITHVGELPLWSLTALFLLTFPPPQAKLVYPPM